jgi:hypothetical protein
VSCNLRPTFLNLPLERNGIFLAVLFRELHSIISSDHPWRPEWWVENYSGLVRCLGWNQKMTIEMVQEIGTDLRVKEE